MRQPKVNYLETARTAGKELNRAGSAECRSVVLLLTEKEASRWLKISPRLLWDLRKAGKIGYVPIGKLIFYTPDQLSEFIEANRKDAHG